ncbi:MAG: HAMP domain-containing histidine kinase [Clostridia bacterium]|jgi:two-component system sensor histidine kinase CiaH|nr:HAMP domain-containing histidine kinase [Clostridia bacterium]
MIEKLSKRIFLLIVTSLSIIISGIIILFVSLNYNNIINTTTLMVDRLVGRELKRNPNEMIEDDRMRTEGLYNVWIENFTVIQSSDISVNEYAIKIAKKNNDKGIIGKYIYKVRRTKDNIVNIILIENEYAILHIKKIVIFSLIMLIISLIIIYIISKKVSKIIVKPVEETFEKQKQFISDASHELKTPLAVIEANADVLESEIGSNKWMSYIQNEIESMNKLINELLILAKVENIDNIKEYEQLNISKEIQIILSMFESIAYEKQVTIKSNIQQNIIINANKEDIEHIICILTDNAIKHTDIKKEVIIELSKEKNEIILQVKNMGEPIPETEKEKIFERFYRIDKSRNRVEKRYGLGLAIAKSIVKKYNGKIEVLYKNNFTIFKVTITN